MNFGAIAIPRSKLLTAKDFRSISAWSFKLLEKAKKLRSKNFLNKTQSINLDTQIHLKKVVSLMKALFLSVK